ncbi:MAG: HAMP domain-containing histidine kinase [Cyanobacteria bacterium SZAS LIN-2]|nr:HAMP domain-containing histidine kinase [Cyanobacteria bacterium SZAS LIN-3]MBS1994872.1 HAMP domain-containing histidine kinase [Cyanobacteria bacterium SZAS LIN-2]
MSSPSTDKLQLPYKPAIGRRGLALVLAPVVLGSCFLLVLNYLWYSSNSLIIKDQRCNELSIALNQSFTALSEYAYAVMNSAFQSKPIPRELLLSERQNAEKHLNLLNSLMTASREPVANERVIQQGLIASFAEVNQMATTMPAGRLVFNLQRVNISSRWLRKGLLISDQIHTFNTQQIAARAQSRKQQDLLQKALESLVFITFASGAAVSVGLFYAFAGSTLTRVKILGRNASALARLEVPTESIDGNDEVAYLDSVFRAVAAELRRARDEHQSIVQMIAHDIRSPMMAAQISISTLEEFFIDALPGAAIQWCEQITAASNHVLAFVDQLLTLEALESDGIDLTPSDFSIRDLVQECILSLSERSGLKSLSIENTCTDTQMRADRRRVAEVISTYLSNAIQSAPEASQIVVSSKTEADCDTVLVRDAGPGLSRLQCSEVFDRSYASDSEADCADFGLGLHICKMLVESHGGRVGAFSESSRDRSFYFSIPRASAGQLSKTQSPAEAQAAGEEVGAGLLGNLRRSLIGKVVVLMVVPLAVQAACLIWIDSQLANSQRLAQLERRQSDLVSMMDELWLRQCRATGNAGFFTVFHNPEYRQRAEEDIRVLRATVDALDTSLASGGNALWHDARLFILDETSALEERMKKTSPEEVVDELARTSDFILPGLSLNNRMAQLTAEQMQSLSTIIQQNEGARAQMEKLIFLAIVFNALLCAGQLWRLRYEIDRRLAILVDNARQLPSRGTLHAPVGGSDEIAALDKLLHRAARELKQADRERKLVMDMVGQNIAGPLQNMAELARKLEAEADRAPAFSARGRNNLEATRRNIGRVQMLTNDLFVIDQSANLKNELQLALVRIAEVVDESMVSVGSLAREKGIQLEAEVSDVAVMLDRKRMIQVLVNLLANSIKFSPAQSTIFIKAHAVASGVQIVVRDQGPGMDQATQAKIFEKFVRQRGQKQQAFGLGLAICRLIVEAHGGQIAVESRPGAGSNFSITIPADA